MADFVYRANLAASTIPVDPLSFGRSVILKGSDQNYVPNLAPKEDEDKDIGIPQVYYAHNVLPTAQGFRSVGFTLSRETCPGTPYIAFPVRSATATSLLIHTEEGDLYRLDPAGYPQFVFLGNYVGNVTYATVAGTTYIHFSQNATYKYNFLTDSLDPVTLAGIALNPVTGLSVALGITGSGGYLLAWTEDSIAWSSLFDPTDFVPSLDTGAGGGSVEGARGAITVCVSNSLGIFIFTEANAVSATLSNNATFPFNFKEITGAGGVTDIQHVTYEGASNTAYAFTSSGFQQISHNGAKAVWPDLSDSADRTPYWDENTVIAPTVGTAGGCEQAKLVTVSSRYVCVSTHAPQSTYFTNIWIYDIALGKWGRIAKDHYDVFEDEDHKLAFIDADGRYVVADNSNTPDENFFVSRGEGVLVLGKYQYSRSRLVASQQVTLDNLYPTHPTDPVTGVELGVEYPDVYVMASIDGKNGSFTPLYRLDEANYLGTKVGTNLSYMVKGNFNLNCVVLTLTNHGGR